MMIHLVLPVLPLFSQYECNKNEVFYHLNNYKCLALNKSKLSLVTKDDCISNKANHFFMNCHVFEGEKPFWIFHNIASDMTI